jgi:hypothetical protein
MMITERLRRAIEQSAIALRPDEQEHLADELFTCLEQNENGLAKLLQLLAPE